MRNLILYLVLSVCFATIGCVTSDEVIAQEQGVQVAAKGVQSDGGAAPDVMGSASFIGDLTPDLDLPIVYTNCECCGSQLCCTGTDSDGNTYPLPPQPNAECSCVAQGCVWEVNPRTRTKSCTCYQ